MGWTCNNVLLKNIGINGNASWSCIFLICCATFSSNWIGRYSIYSGECGPRTCCSSRRESQLLATLWHHRERRNVWILCFRRTESFTYVWRLIFLHDCNLLLNCFILVINPLNPEFTIVIFIHYKPRMSQFSASSGLKWLKVGSK